ncbi:MAG: UDP-N-acetylmuramate:L-alanyl-gamma-D-glutamyl-meso-diaminopimelate ligase, partial [Deltaproteobacteria bacterium]
VKGKGKDAMFFEDFDSMLNFLLEYTRSGDVVLFMSNGAFDLLPKRLFEYLVKRGIN